MRLLPVYPKCFVGGWENECGIDISFYNKDDIVVVSCTLTERHAGYPGVVHGGIIASLLDEVMGRIVGSATKKMAMTGKFTIKYRKPLPVGTPITVEGKMASDPSPSRKLWKASSEMRGEDGALYASAEGSFYAIPEENYPQILSDLKIKGENRDVVLEDL